MEIKVLGIFEKVDFPQFGIKSITAKVDSGADTGALHCTQVTEEQTEKGPVLHFSPFDYPDVKITTDEFFIKDVKSSNGSIERRYFIKTFVVVQSETYKIFLSLTDRSSMRWPVLIGRRFLSKNSFLIDVNKESVESEIKAKVEKL